VAGQSGNLYNAKKKIGKLIPKAIKSSLRLYNTIAIHLRKMTYIQFKVPENKHKYKPDGFIKRSNRNFDLNNPESANPDFDDKIDLVENWVVKLEFQSVKLELTKTEKSF
jgi:hypothetical protein